MSRVAAAAAALLLGCSNGLGPAPEGKQFSIIDIGTSMPQDFLATPGTVSAGGVIINYNSFGSSSCNIPAGESVAMSAGMATITAYDRYVPPEAVCTADMGRYQRSVTLTLAPGTVELRLRGIRLLGGNEVGDLRRTVLVK